MSSPLKPKRRKAEADGRNHDESRHIRFHHWMLKGPAWCSLSCNAKALMLEIWVIYNGMNNGEIALSIRTAGKRLHIAPNTAHNAFRELEAKGFIRPNVKGNFGYKMRHATTWIITALEYNGQLASKDFMSWGQGKMKNPVAMDDTAGLNG